jgi:hypothetical protein
MINSGEDSLLKAHLGQFLIEVRDENLDEVKDVLLHNFDPNQPVFLPFVKDALEILNNNPQFPKYLHCIPGREVKVYMDKKDEIKLIMKEFIKQSEAYEKL